MFNSGRIFKTIRSIFRKKKIIFLGRVGLKYFDKGKIYLLDSELLSSGQFDVELYNENIYIVQNKNKILLSENEKKSVFEKVRLELENMGLRVKSY